MTPTKTLLYVLAIALVLVISANAEKVLYSFSGGSDGGSVYSGVVIDQAGKIYGTASSGGAYGCGVVYQLTLVAGAWTETVLHNFNGAAGDGCSPYAGLMIDAAGNLYGTTFYGGATNQGTAFELVKNAGTWSETILHGFGATITDGTNPYGGLVLDNAGYLYGTTENGGKFSSGTVFRLRKLVTGKWAEVLLHQFNYTAGGAPLSTLTFDSAGNLYGTTEYGGRYQHGTVFRLTRTPTGGWGFKMLHQFNPATGDGYLPQSGVVVDASGSVYGTTLYGGSGNGTVYRVYLNASGVWNEVTIHSFQYENDGINPYGALAIDSAGNLYGTTWQSLIGNTGGAGIVFKLTPSSGSWSETVLQNFVTGAGNPYSGVLLHKGHIYGTSYFGGYGNGTVYEL